MTSLILSLTNEVLTAAIVIVAASILFYNLSRNLTDRIARTSGAVLACVTVTYTVDVFISLSPDLNNYITALRVQWIGLAFLPATLFHLSDALLATTGLPSRGRRRLGTRILYGVSGIFVMLVLLSDVLVAVEPLEASNVASMRPGPLFWVYVAYFISATVLAYNTVQRAKERCLTRDTRRRMGYLQFALLTPAIGIFPYSVLLGAGNEFSLGALIMVNVTNIVVIFMIIFLSYPLSFFGSQIPDRVVKSELLSFFMRGPATGMLILVTIIFTGQATQILGIDGNRFMPFAVVIVVLTWQWTIVFALPSLETLLIYGDEDSFRLDKLRNLSNRILSESDLRQLIHALLQATCDYLQVNSAFAARFQQSETTLIESVGPIRPSTHMVAEEQQYFTERFMGMTIIGNVPIESWESYWVAPLYSTRQTDERSQPTLIGIMGIQARSETLDLTEDESERLNTFVHQVEQALDDLALQEEVYAALEGLIPQLNITRSRAAEVEYLPGRASSPSRPTTLPTQEQMIEQVHAALKHYWGGPGLTKSRLLDLQIVRDCVKDNDQPTQALRTILHDAIEHLRPPGERQTTAPEWVLYNILEMRFVQGVKVKEVAKRLSRSEANTYRKQKIAIETVAKTLEQWERDRISSRSL
jgi:uncharacterized protein (DUF2384 family)